MKIFKLVMLSMVFSLVSINIHANEEDPGKVVKETVERVLTVLKDKNLDEEKKRSIVFKLAEDRINFKDMSRRILATNWNNASEDQKERFEKLFQEILLNTYWIRMSQYTGERVEYISVSEVKDGYAIVDTIIIRDGSDVQIPISYRMKRFVNIWFAYDFIVESLSLVQSYRNEYRATIKNYGIDGLLDLMKQEVDSYDA